MKLLHSALVVLPLLLGAPSAFAATAGETLFDGRGIHYLESRGAIVADSWQPTETISRAEFVEMVTTLVYEHDLHAGCFADLASTKKSKYDMLFKEISLDHPLAVHLCVGLKTGIIHGNKDGSFSPEAKITVAEASQILYRAYDMGPLNRKSAVGKPWYAQPMHDLQVAALLPGKLYDTPLHRVTREEAGEMLMRMRGHETRLRQAGDLRVMRGASMQNPTTTTLTRVEDMSTPAGAADVDVIDISHREGNIRNDAPLGMVKVYARGIEWVIPRPVSRR